MTEKSVKTCTKSGQWLAKGDLEWTDYTTCLNKQVSWCRYLLNDSILGHTARVPVGMPSVNNSDIIYDFTSFTVTCKLCRHHHCVVLRSWRYAVQKDEVSRLEWIPILIVSSVAANTIGRQTVGNLAQMIPNVWTVNFLYELRMCTINSHWLAREQIAFIAYSFDIS